MNPKKAALFGVAFLRLFRRNVSRETNEQNLKIFAQFIKTVKSQAFHGFMFGKISEERKNIFEKMFHVKQTNIT